MSDAPMFRIELGRGVAAAQEDIGLFVRPGTHDTEPAERIVETDIAGHAGHRYGLVVDADIGLAFNAEKAIEIVATANNGRVHIDIVEVEALIAAAKAELTLLGRCTGSERKDGKGGKGKGGGKGSLTILIWYVLRKVRGNSLVDST